MEVKLKDGSVLEVVSRCGANILSVHHDSSDPNMPINSCFVRLIMETRDNEQVQLIRQEFAKGGFQIVG